MSASPSCEETESPPGLDGAGSADFIGRGVSVRWGRLKGRIPDRMHAGIFSLGWVGLAQVVSLLTRLASNLLLTRMLAPEVYGILGTALAVLTTLDWLSDLGVQPALIRHPEGGSPRFLNTGWWITVGRGLVLWVIAAGLAAPLSRVYHQPELFAVLLALSLRPALLTLRSPGYPTLRRALNYRALFLDEMAQLVVGTSVSLGLAYTTHSIWAIVGGTLAGTVVAVLSSYVFCPTLPRRGWDGHVAREISLLSRQIFVNTLVMAVWTNLDRLLGLRFVSPVEMGYYTVAVNLATIAETMLARFCDVYFSSISRWTDLAKRERWHRWLTLRLAVLGMPLLAFGVLAAPTLIHVMYDSRYAKVGVIFPILIARLMVRSLGHVQFQYLLSNAEVWINTRAYVVGMLLQAALFIPFVTTWGAGGMAGSALLSATAVTGVQYGLARHRKLDGVAPFFITLGWMVAALLALHFLPTNALPGRGR